MSMFHRSPVDPKVTSLENSWLGLTHQDARWLASTADIAISRAGERLDTQRFTYLPLDEAYAGLVIDSASNDARLACPTTVLVVPDAQMAELASKAKRVGDTLRDRSNERVPA